MAEFMNGQLTTSNRRRKSTTPATSHLESDLQATSSTTTTTTNRTEAELAQLAAELTHVPHHHHHRRDTNCQSCFLSKIEWRQCVDLRHRQQQQQQPNYLQCGLLTLNNHHTICNITNCKRSNYNNNKLRRNSYKLTNNKSTNYNNN